MNKGCLIAAGIVATLGFLALGGCVLVGLFVSEPDATYSDESSHAAIEATAMEAAAEDASAEAVTVESQMDAAEE